MIASIALCSKLKLLVINTVLKLVKRQPLDILYGNDAVMQYISVYGTKPSAELQITGVTLMKGTLDLEAFRRIGLVRLVEAQKTPGKGPKKFPRLKYRIIRKYGYYVWEEDPDFCIDNHFVLHPVGFTDEASLMEIVQKVHNTPWNEGQPLWQFIFVPRVGNKSPKPNVPEDSFNPDFAFLGKFQHSLNDGLTIVNIYHALADKNFLTQIEDFKKKILKNPENIFPLIKNNPFIRYMAGKKRSMTLREFGAISLNALHMVFGTPWWIIELLIAPVDKNNFHTRPLSGCRLVTLTQPVDFDLFKTVAKKLNCSVNVLFFSCMGKALQESDPKATSIRMMLPMVLMPPGYANSQNGIAVASVDLPLHFHSAKERIKAYTEIINRAKLSPMPLFSFAIARLLGNHFPLSIAKFLFTMPSFTLIATSLAGLPFIAEIDGRVVIENSYLPCTDKTYGIGFALLTYSRNARIGITVDKAIATDDNMADTLGKDCIKELIALNTMAKIRTQ